LEAPNFNFAFDVLRYVAAEITFDGVVLIYEVSYFDNFFVS
tara:strand:- start:896 stop:1018 length:123 start_codon:yes stop_codon:yes gene_type:complete